jgi:hypothetical protein
MLNPNSAKLAKVDDELRAGVTHSIRAAQDYLLQIQHADGHWCGELEGDTILESEYILTMHFVGRLHEDRCRKAANYIREKMLPGGGWAIYEGGPPEVSASAKAYFVLKLLGDSPEAPHMRESREVIRELGGLDAANRFISQSSASIRGSDARRFHLKLFCCRPGRQSTCTRCRRGREES